AINDIGAKDLKKALSAAKKGKWGARYGDVVENGISNLESILPEDAKYKRKLSVLLLLNDPFIRNYLEKTYGNELIGRIKSEVGKTSEHFRGNLTRLINNKRSQWIDSVVTKVIKKQKIVFSSFAQTFARLSRHPVWGIPILGIIIAVMYFLVVHIANSIAGWMDETLWVPVYNQINNLLPSGFWNEFLIGDYGILSLGLSNAILTVLPILSVFFIMFNILEDIGYIPNLCVLTKKVFEKVGLSGNAIMPLVLGFGCKTMATLSTKSLRSKKERYISIYLIAFAIPCAAQMGLNMSILGRMGFRAFVIAFSTLALVETLAGLILNKILAKEKKSNFIQELPAIRLPSVKAVLRKTYFRLYEFLKEALPVFVIAAAALFFIDKIGILDVAKNILSPVMKGFLGLPAQMVDALILCMARHEAAAGMIIKMVERGELNYVQCIVAVTITTMFVPCFANIMAMIKELGAKTALTMTMAINISSFVLAGALNWILLLSGL
ncbi:MAG: nucleoside recognition domain-containing protein, partial [Candidatus Omnitrophota bacterium]